MLGGTLTCTASPAFTEDNAVKAIVGEAANQGYIGMLAVAGAIRNRGTLQGIYGLEHNPKWMYDQPHWVWKRALRAWQASATNDITHGAQYWESTDFKRPKWSRDMTITAHYGKHIFYRQPNYKKPL